MATIATLALKISSDFGDLTKNAQDIINSIDNIAKVAGIATPSMKNLEDASKGYAISLDAIKKAQDKHALSPTPENLQLWRDATNMVDRLRDSVGRLGQGVAGDILKMTPTINNVMEAQKQIQKLKELRNELANRGGNVTGLDTAIAQATDNLGTLTRRTSEAQIQTQILNSTIMAVNNLPFMILSSVLKDVCEWFVKITGIWNENSKGWYGTVARTVAVFAALTVVIGLLYSRQTMLNGATTYFHALWNSSIIIQGIKGFISLLGTVIAMITAAIFGTNGWTAAQWQLNIAMAANPIGAIVAIIITALALIVGFVYLIWTVWSWWSKTEQKAAELKSQIKMTENVTSAFRDRIGEVIERYKELNKLAKQYHEDNLTNLQKYENKIKEIDDVLSRQNVANDAMKAINMKNNELVKMMDVIKKTGNKDAISSLQKLIDDVEKDRIALQKEMKKPQVLSAEDAEAAKEKARLALLQGQFGDLFKKTLAPQQQYAKEMTDLAELMKKVKVTEGERHRIEINALKKRNDAAISLLGIGELIKPIETARDIYDKNISNLKTALQLNVINLQQFSNGVKHAVDAFAQATGIKKYFEKVETLRDVYSNMAIYAERMNLSQEDLVAAQDKARLVFEKQAESYSLYQKAQDALLSTEEKVTKAMNMIDADAFKFGWSEEITDKMKQIAEAEIMGKKEKQKDNQVIVRGS
ncbi:MAG: hypothetical protein LBL13_13255, partial [Bacteroidales bacterium]|nr:hypothetical protein [Bacteroidales bacterium]